jgi:alkylresorcinol/alkylpyrone synthase
MMFDPNRINKSFLAEQVMPEIIQGNVKLVSECISNTLTACSMNAQHVDHIFCSSPVFAAPAISIRTMEHIPFRKNIKHSPMMGLGCVGGVALLSRATDYLKAYPKHAVATVTAESGSRFWNGTLQQALRKLLSADQTFDKEKVLQ